MHHGHGHGNGNGNGNGKRWVLIGLLILGGFWLINDAYGDGYRDALVQTGQAGNVRYYRGGPDFPWGLLIIGGLAYVAWRKGAFDRFGGGSFGPAQGNGGRAVQPYGAPPSGHGYVGFRGPRGIFEEWHREAHEANRARAAAPPPPPSPAPPTTPNGDQTARPEAPPPPPPAPEYWAAMHPPAAPNPHPAESVAGNPGATGPGPERW
jgi:hypothetical protein